MPSRNGYMPLSGNDHENEEHFDNEEQSDQANTNNCVTTSEEAPTNEPLIDLGDEQAAAQGDTHGDHLGAQITHTSISGATLSATTHSRSLAQAQLSSSKATSGAPSSSTSPSSHFQFPRFIKHKSLLSLKERLQNPNPNSSSSSSYTRLFSSKSHGADLSNYYPSDLAHIRPKQRPHTTLSGPREIQKSQKRRVLQEIRPDPYNLPVELLREQAKSGAVANGLTPGSDHTGPGDGVSGNNMRGERGTLLGSGDGLGLGIGLGGNRWSKTTRSRQRRMPSMGGENDHRVVHSSVFTPVLESVSDGQPVIPAPALTPDHAEPMTSQRFVGIVDSVKEAIRSGIQPLRIAQGSSGSYFCRNLDGKVVGVFKPKNEEPYGQLNPKWAKWIHRNLFPLIPNLGYISESATSLVDRRLKLNIVPSTEVVWLSSPAFHYDYLDRRAAQTKHGAKPLPDKVGSFQLFLNGFKDANIFMRDHPWPEPMAQDPNGKGRYYGSWRRSTASLHSQQDETGSLHGSIAGSTQGGGDRSGFQWTPALQQQFKEQFEKMIILDYLIRNTDRGLDNWMIRYCEKEGISVVAGPTSQKSNQTQQQQQAARRNSRVGDLLGLYSDRARSSSSSLRETAARNSMLATPPGTPPRTDMSRTASGIEVLQDEEHDGSPSQSGRPHSPTPRPLVEGDGTKKTLDVMEAHYGSTHVHVAAIDNGLAFPFKHPDSWRSYPYGWLFLPRPLIAQPFTKATRDHFLPLLSSPVWWKETIADLRRLFSIDSDFDQGMFDKQMAVMKGQGWNIVETLKNLDQGPMDLCRRVAVVVWDEEVTLEANPSQHRQPSPTQGYTAVQPMATKTMDPGLASQNYGSALVGGGSLSSSKGLMSTSSTDLYGHKHIQGSIKDPVLPLHTVVDMENETDQPRHDSFRQVVSDGEYSIHDDDDYDYDDDDDDYSYDEEEYDEFDHEQDPLDDLTRDDTGMTSLEISPVPREGMVSIDMTLAEERPLGPSKGRRGRSESGAGNSRGGWSPDRSRRNHRRRQSHQSDVGTGAGRSRTRTKSGPLSIPEDGDLSASSPPKNHRRRRTEQDDKVGTIRFDPSTPKTGDTSPEMERSRMFDASGRTSGEEEDEDEGEERRGRPGFFNRGYGSIRQKDDGRLSERPKWADRLRRGLSFDGHLLVGGIGQTARRERKLRKQKQRERELRERRVILVERIEPVTKNLPYFKWW
ncbi:phosphatidyl inositol kinase [Podila minutissima]|nr:phosphatidyl inositol kinase [Podila minutissima]